MSARNALLRDGLTLAVSLTFLSFIGADIYIWLSRTPAPLTGVYAYFSNTLYFWGAFHAGLCVALVATAVLAFDSVMRLKGRR